MPDFERVRTELARADAVVVGAGFFGLVIAERIAESLGRRVVVIDRRSHIGGNAHSQHFPGTEIEVHSYGTHVFHTSSRKVWEYVNRFSDFSDYRHQVLALHDGGIYPMPINLMTINAFFGTSLSPLEARAFIAAQVAESRADPDDSLESRAISLVGRPLYEAFVRGYSEKQWQEDPRNLPAEIINRLPVRFDYRQGYFDDPWQGQPVAGYTSLCERMVEHPLISLFTGVDYFDIRDHVGADHRALTVYSGPLDRFYDDAFGRLSWRTLDFEWEVRDTTDFQGAAVINMSDASVPYTRVHEFRHLHPERSHPADCTVIAREFSRAAVAGDEPYYPVNLAEDRRLAALYRERAGTEADVLLGGRLGSYKYLDMDMAIAAALRSFERSIVPWFAGVPLHETLGRD